MNLKTKEKRVNARTFPNNKNARFQTGPRDRTENCALMKENIAIRDLKTLDLPVGTQKSSR